MEPQRGAPQPTPWWRSSWWALALLAVGIARQLWVNLRWVAEDQRVGHPVASGMTWWLNEAIQRYSMGELWTHHSTIQRSTDAFSLAGLAGWLLFGQEPDAALWVVLAFLVATQILLLDLGRRLGSVWAGLAAALMLAIAPDLSAMSRCWASQVPHLLLLVGAADCLVASRSFSRVLPSLGFAAFAVVGVSFTEMTTDNLLFGMVAASMAAFAWGRGLVLGRGPRTGPEVSRGWALALGLMVVATVLAGAWFVHFEWVSLDYYGAEMGNDSYHTVATWWHPQALTAYTRWLFWYGLGPPLALAAFIGLGAFCWHGHGRAELLGWVLVPLLVISVLYKKNPYYAAGIYPGLLLAGTLGLQGLTRRWPKLRAPVWITLVLAIGVAWHGWEKGSQRRDGPRPTGPMADGEQVFQTFKPPDLRPARMGPDLRELRLIRRQIPESSCPRGQRLCFDPKFDDTAQVLVGHSQDPCLIHDANDDGEFWGCDLILVRDFNCKPTGGQFEPSYGTRKLMKQGFEIRGGELTETPCLWMLQRVP